MGLAYCACKRQPYLEFRSSRPSQTDYQRKRGGSLRYAAHAQYNTFDGEEYFSGERLVDRRCLEAIQRMMETGGC